MSVLFGMLAFSPGSETAVAQSPTSVATVQACPTIWRFTRIGVTDTYYVVLRSDRATQGDAHLEFIAGNDAYALDLSTVRIDTATAAHLIPFRSQAIVFRSPTRSGAPQQLIARFGGTWTSCPPSAVEIVRYEDERFVANDRTVAAYADVARAISNEAMAEMPRDLSVESENTASCVEKNIDAKPTQPVRPQYPEIASLGGFGGTVLAIVDIDANGNVLDSDIYQTSGNPSLDAATRDAARSSTYVGATIACTKTGGLYIFRADFRR